MGNGAKGLLWNTIKFASRAKGTLKGLVRAPRVASQPQHIQGARKGFAHRLLDNLWWALRYGCPEPSYALYGLDLRGARLSDYLDERRSMKLRVLMNKPSSDNECIILTDKRLFALYMERCGMPLPDSVGILRVRGGYAISLT